MNKDKKVIIFGFNDVQKDKLLEICSKYNASFKILENNMIKNKIADILEDNIIENTVNEKEVGSILNEKVILFDNFNEEELNKIILDIRTYRELSCILAVVTKGSRQWQFTYLLEHLIEERNWFKKNNK